MSPEATAAPAARVERGGNLVALTLIQVFRLFSGFAVNVMVMRGLGVEGFGVYGYVLTLVGLLSFGSSMGMDRLIKREAARDESRLGHYVATGLAASALLSLFTGLAIVGWAAAVDGRAVVVIAAAVASLALALQTLAYVPVAAFHAVRRMGLGVGANAVGRVVLVGATALFLWGQLGVVAVFAAQVLDGLVSLVVAARVYRRELGLGGLATTWPEVREFVRECLPFGFNQLFVSVYLSVDVLLLGQFWDDAEVGRYRGAVMLLSLFPIVADTLSTGLYPRMAKHLGDREKAGQELRFAARVLLAVSVPAAVGGAMVADRLFVFLGGAEWAVSAPLFVLLVPLLPFRYLNNLFGMALSALDHQQARTNGAILAAVVNVGLNLATMPRYGALGASAVTFATELVLILFMWWRVRPLVSSLGLGGSLLKVAPAAVLMAGLVWLTRGQHVLVSVIVGALGYGAVALGTGALRRADLRELRRV